MCLSETNALRLAQQGDAAAFEYLFHLHSRHVYAVCLRMVGNKTEAENLTQGVFLQSFRKIQSFRGESAFSRGLLRATANLVLKRRAARNIPSTSDVLVLEMRMPPDGR